MAKIEILDRGQVVVPATVAMTDYEIAQLLGVTLSFVRGAIKRLLKSRTGVECSGGVVLGRSLIPEYFGLEVVIAIAFQVDSYEANLFRKWMMTRVTKCDLKDEVPIIVTLPNNQIYN